MVVDLKCLIGLVIKLYIVVNRYIIGIWKYEYWNKLFWLKV